MFELDPRLAADCVTLGDFDLCRLLLMNDGGYPWCILVPRIRGASEIHALSQGDRYRLCDESARLSAWMASVFGAHKMNVAALGNVVPQLHVHHVVRFPGDPAWPGPVWGHRAPVPYTPEALAALWAKLDSAPPEGLAVAAH